MPEPVRPSRGRALTATLALATLLAAAAALPRPALAQQPAAQPASVQPADTTTLLADPRLVPGARVRIGLRAYRGLRVEGIVDSVLARSIVVDTAARRQFLIFSAGPMLLDQYRLTRVRMEEIETVEVSAGNSRWRGALRWGLIAAALGAGVNALANSPERNPTSRDMLQSATEGAVLGAVLGGTFGYLQGREQWRPVRLGGAR